MPSSRAEEAAAESDTSRPAPPELYEKPRYRWEELLAADHGIGGKTRVRVRSRLTVARWPGNIDAAARVCAKLTENAVLHAKPLSGNAIGIRLVCPQDSDDLLIEVADGLADFPGFDHLSTCREPSGTPCGLWWVHHYRGRITWRLNYGDACEAIGKTVQVVLPRDWGE